MRSKRLNINFRSLRFRLLVWNTAVVVLIVIVTLLAVREGLRLTLIRELDEVLKEDALEIRLAVEQLYPRWDLIQQEINRKAVGHAHRELFVQVFDASARPMSSSSNVPREADQLGKAVTARTLPGGAFRIASDELNKPTLPRLRIRVGSTLRFVREDVAKLSRMSVWVAIAIVPLASWGGWWLAGRAIKPIAHISGTAARLRPARLDERLPIRPTGDELEQLSRTINDLLDRIAAYLAQNREFIANAAHELRSPLAAIQSSVEVTLNADRRIDEYQELLYEIVEECSSLAGLVNQLLLLAESDGPALVNREAVRLDQLVNRSLDMFRGVAEERNIDLRASRLDPVTVRGDATSLWQVVNNLVDNALKFSHPGGHVSVDVHEDRPEGPALIRVTDDGCGIAPQDLPHVFERFFQGDRSRQRQFATRGSGLGLSICQAIVDAHGGSITVTSTVNQGTQFTVVLPALFAEGVKPTVAAAEPAAS